MSELVPYPRTTHLEGSRLQPGQRDDGVLLKDLPPGLQVWEEKLDGTQTGLGFDEDDRLILQSRGHILQSGTEERQFGLLRLWADAYEVELYEILGRRYVLFAEWLYAKHSVFYDDLPTYLFEEDIYDRETGQFLSTERRQALLQGGPVRSVPILHTGELETQKAVKDLIRRPLYQTGDWRANLTRAAAARGQDPERVLAETCQNDRAEGVYLKLEDPDRGIVVGRYKWVEPDFLATILQSGSHWASRPPIPNALTPGIDFLLDTPQWTGSLSA